MLAGLALDGESGSEAYATGLPGWHSPAAFLSEDVMQGSKSADRFF
jgi:hypothetical protein